MKEPKVTVGIMSEPQIEFNLLNHYRMFGTYCSGVVTHSMVVTGKQVAAYSEGRILWNGRQYDDLVFYPIYEETDSFELLGVTIGINFHWERKEDQRFQGALKFIVEGEKLTAINEINVEDYLTSVISSEMSATASPELLKAHAVISRSWLLKSLSGLSGLSPGPSPVGRGEDSTGYKTEGSTGYKTEGSTGYKTEGSTGYKTEGSTGYKTADGFSYGVLREKQKELKKNPTETESIVWERLRNGQLGVKFRRQHIIDSYIVDFVCLEKHLIIEIDGGYHSDPKQMEKDNERTLHLESLGYHLLRFSNEEVIAQPDTVIATIKAHITPANAPTAQPPLPTGEGPGEGLLWYERSSHLHFHVCADDHCQRYQGITRASTDAVKQAIDATRGQVLMYEGKICDARFSKCCGGALEEFQYCWADTPHSYLRKQRDFRIFSPKSGDLSYEATMPASGLPDLTDEMEADIWIRTSPPAFCNTRSKEILSQVLNNYDQETTDFYRWKVAYTQDELSALILSRSGVDYGQIIDLVPIARGTSGRLWKLKIVGTKQTRIIGKELEIRRTLSASHLYSSAFVVDKEGAMPVDAANASAGCQASEVPARFILTGAGWGHGVGLCQIGAAVMAEEGYTYDVILRHYYKGEASPPYPLPRREGGRE